MTTPSNNTNNSGNAFNYLRCCLDICIPCVDTIYDYLSTFTETNNTPANPPAAPQGSSGHIDGSLVAGDLQRKALVDSVSK